MFYILFKVLEFNSTKNKFPQTLKYVYKNNKHVSFTISKSNSEQIDYMRNRQKLISCLNETIRRNAKFDSIWNSVYAANFNMRLGKSLFVSNQTEMATQHRIHLFSNNEAIEKIVPRQVGYSSHIRELIEGFFTSNQFLFDQFHFDLEFYEFLASF